MITTDQLRQIVKTAHLLQPRTRQLYSSVIDMFEDDRGTRVTTEDIEAWRDALYAEGRTPQTVNNYLAALKAACKRLARKGGPNPAEQVEPLKVKRTADGARVLSLVEVRKLAPQGSTLWAVRDRAMMICNLRTGLRRRELCSFAFETWDRRKSGFRVVLKGGNEHLALLDTEAQEALDQWVGRLAKLGVKTGRVWRSMSLPRADGSIFMGRELTESAYYGLVRGHAEAAGLGDDIHPHTFRHTFVTWCRGAGVPDWEIALATGHRRRGAEVAMMDKYTRIETAVAEKLPRVFESRVYR